MPATATSRFLAAKRWLRPKSPLADHQFLRKPRHDPARSRLEASRRRAQNRGVLKETLCVSFLLCAGCSCAVDWLSAQEKWVPPGTYSEPFAPRLATPAAPAEALITPSLTFDSPSPVVGASSYTGSPTGSSVVFNQPVSYDPGIQFSSPFYPSSNATAPEESAAREWSGHLQLRRRPISEQLWRGPVDGQSGSSKSGSGVYESGCRAPQRYQRHDQVWRQAGPPGLATNSSSLRPRPQP